MVVTSTTKPDLPKNHPTHRTAVVQAALQKTRLNRVLLDEPDPQLHHNQLLWLVEPTKKKPRDMPTDASEAHGKHGKHECPWINFPIFDPKII